MWHSAGPSCLNFNDHVITCWILLGALPGGLKPDDSQRSLLKTSCSLDVITHCSGISSLDPTSYPVDRPHTKLFLSHTGRDSLYSRLSCGARWINQIILRPHSPKTSDSIVTLPSHCDRLSFYFFFSFVLFVCFSFPCLFVVNSCHFKCSSDRWESESGLILGCQLRKNVLKGLLMRNVDVRVLPVRICSWHFQEPRI